MKNVEAKKAHRSRNDYPAGEQSSKEPAQGGSRFHATPVQPAGRGSRTERQKKVGTSGSIANGFLKTQFLPRLNAIEVPTGEESESELYHSLNLLCEFYDISLPETKSLGYPYNVTMALQILRKEFPKEKQKINSINFDVRGVDFVSIERNEELDHKLFYVGVQELYEYSQKHKSSAEVLLGIYSYLYYNANVCYHLDDGSFLFYHYDMIREQIEEEADRTDMYDPDEMREYQLRRTELELADMCSEKILSQMRAFHNGPRTLKSVLKRFQPFDEFEQKIKAVAEKFQQLDELYPKHSIHAKSGLEMEPDAYADSDEGELNYATIITMDECISFIHNADMNTGISGEIEYNVDIDLQECYIQDFPTVVRTFNKDNDYKSASLDFENQFFPLLEELIDIVFDLPKCDTLSNILGDNL